MPVTRCVTAKAIQDAHGDGASNLRVEIGKEFLHGINLQAAWRGMTVRDFVIESILLNSVEIKVKE